MLNLTLTPATFLTLVTSIDAAKSATANAVSDKQSSANVNIYATNYNVLRIMSGMGGLAYSN